MVKKIDLTGQRFGRLVVIRELEERQGIHIKWECVCDCGNKHNATGSNLKKPNHTRSCGCLHKEKSSNNLKKIHSQTIDARKGKDFVERTSLSLLTAKTSPNNTSGHKGVTWVKSSKSWLAQIQFKGTHYYLGSFHNVRDAIKARKEAEDKYFNPILDKYGKMVER